RKRHPARPAGHGLPIHSSSATLEYRGRSGLQLDRHRSQPAGGGRCGPRAGGLERGPPLKVPPVDLRSARRASDAPDRRSRDEYHLDRIAFTLTHDAEALVDIIEREVVGHQVATTDLALRGQ